MRIRFEIDYHWTCDQSIDIPEKHKDALEEDAEERIFEQLKANMTQGELCTSIRFGKEVVPEEHEEDGLTYSGWWFKKIIE